MKKRRILINSILSSLLLTTTLTAQSITCNGKNCFIDISKLAPSKSVDSKMNSFKNLKKPHFSAEHENSIEETTSMETIVLEHSKYVMDEKEKKDYIQKNIAYYDSKDTIILEHNKYVMTDAEKEEYYVKQRLEEIAQSKEAMMPMITIDNALTKEVILPHSELYCDSSKQAKFYPESNYYECT